MTLNALTGGDFTLLLWGAAVTPLFAAVNDSRSKNWLWVFINLGFFVALVILGLFWNKIPSVFSEVLQARADSLFLVGVAISSIIYSLMRRNWIIKGDRSIISGFGEGIAIFAFVTLIVSPFLDPDFIGDIFVRQREVFAAGGIVGLILVFTDSLSSEKEAEMLERIRDILGRKGIEPPE